MTKHVIKSLFVLLLLLNSFCAFAQKYTGLTVTQTNATNQNFQLLFDGNTQNNQWQESEVKDDIWFVIDMGKKQPVGVLKFYWEAANAKDYDVSFSDDGVNFTDKQELRDMAAGNRIDDIDLRDKNINCRYIKFQGIKLQLGYGYSIFEIEIYPPIQSSFTSLVFTNPAGTSVKTGESLQLGVQGKDQMGNDISLPGSVQWNVEEQGATVSATGLFTATKPGLYTVTATCNGVTATLKVEAIPSDKNRIKVNSETSTASSVKEGDYGVALAFDGDYNTRWASRETETDAEYITADLGASYDISDMRISWEGANARNYYIEVSEDNQTWTRVIEKNDMPAGGRIDMLYGLTDVKGRYVRLTGTKPNGPWGYSIFEWEFYGSNAAVAGDKEPPTAPASVSVIPYVYTALVSWTASTDNVGVDHYIIYVDGQEKFNSPANELSQTISNLNPNTKYTFGVRAFDANGNASEMTTAEATTKEFTKDDEVKDGVGNIASNMTATASSVAGDYVPGNAVDGNMNTRWASNGGSDNEWLTVNLGLRFRINQAVVNWETASAKHYVIEVSEDNENWVKAVEFNKDNLPETGRSDTLEFATVIGKYVRLRCIKRNTGFGYSVYEFELYSPGSGPGDVVNFDPDTRDPKDRGPFASTDKESFNVVSPNDPQHVKPVVTGTRSPQLKWNAMDGAASYDVYLNKTLMNYDWYAVGSLLERYTKVGNVSSTTFDFAKDVADKADAELPDRWTYKWYVIARNAQGDSIGHSDVGEFSLYNPELTTVDDGINIKEADVPSYEEGKTIHIKYRDMNGNGQLDDFENWTLPVNKRVDDLMTAKMDDKQKAFQMFYVVQQNVNSGWGFGPFTPQDNFKYQMAVAGDKSGLNPNHIPYIVLGDNIHGYQTTYPVQSALAAARDPQLAHDVADVQRREQLVVGARGVLGPLAEVDTKVLYPRSQEGNGEDAEYAAAQVRAMICGMQGGPEVNPSSVMVTVKHWPGEGAGGESGIVYDAITAKYHLKPWFAAVEAGAASIMPGYAGCSFMDPGGSYGAGDSKKILAFLREKLRYEGIICTDWLPWGAWIRSAQAGADVMGGANPVEPGFSMDQFISEVGMDKINLAVRRILDVKFRLGIFEDPYKQSYDKTQGYVNDWHTTTSKQLVVKAARKAVTMLKNDKVDGNRPLPLSSDMRVVVTGSRADDGESYRIWTSPFHGHNYIDDNRTRQYGDSTMQAAIKAMGDAGNVEYVKDVDKRTITNPDAYVVIVGEPSGTHGTMWELEKPWLHDAKDDKTMWDNGNGRYKDENDSTTLRRVMELARPANGRQVPVITVVVMPRPYILTNDIDKSDAVLIAYRGGDGAGQGLAEILYGKTYKDWEDTGEVIKPSGSLPWDLPRSMDQVGPDKLNLAKEKWDLPFDLGATSAERQEIRSIIARGEQPEAKYGNPLYHCGYGLKEYEEKVSGITDLQKDAPSSTTNGGFTFSSASDRLQLSWTGDVKSVEVYQISGRKQLSTSVPSGSNALAVNTSGWEKGIYIIRVCGENSKFVRKFIKQ